MGRPHFLLVSLLLSTHLLDVSSSDVLIQQSNGGSPSQKGGSLNYVVSLTLPNLPSEDGFPPSVDLDFIGFAFEEASFPRYVQTRDGNVNEYTLNLIHAIMSRTGGKPIIRLGGTSADYGRYIADQLEPALPEAEVWNYQNVGGTSIGPSYWDLTHIIPNSVYIVQLPMAHTNVSESVFWAKTAAERIGLDRIQAFEPGNEPDLYSDKNPPNGLGPPDYQGKMTNETYTGNFTKYTNAVKAALGLEGGPWFQAFDTASHRGPANAYILDVKTNFDLGINAGNDINTVAGHYYQTNGGTSRDLAKGLMQHSHITRRLDLHRKHIDYLRYNDLEIPYIISEVGNSLNPKHDYSYQAVLGSALWAVDFQLYAMSIGVARINWQQIMHSGFDLWLPVDSGDVARQTFASFYAMPFVGDFIGELGSTRALFWATPVENLAGYVAADGKDTRVAFVNLDCWDLDDGERPSVTLKLDMPKDYRRVRVDVLGSPQGAHASADSITYAGSQWTAETEGLEVKGVRNDSQILEVRDGKVDLEVWSSSAILVHLLL